MEVSAGRHEFSSLVSSHGQHLAVEPSKFNLFTTIVLVGIYHVLIVTFVSHDIYIYICIL